jgi:hypothetical protein
MMCQPIISTSHSTLLTVAMISTQNKVLTEVMLIHRASDDALLQFHQLKWNFNLFDKFYLKALKFARFSMHECNAHICSLSISSLKSWDATCCIADLDYKIIYFTNITRIHLRNNFVNYWFGLIRGSHVLITTRRRRWCYLVECC